MTVKPFRFRENRIPFDLDGHVIYIPLAVVRKKISQSVQNEIPQCEAILKSGDNAENVARCAAILAAWFRELLGDNAFQKVFGERKTVFADWCDAYRYICDVTTEYCTERISGGKSNEPVDR